MDSHSISTDAKKIAEEIIHLSEDRGAAIDAVINELTKIESGTDTPRVYFVAKKLINNLKYYGDAGYVSVSRFTFPSAKIFPGDILVQSFPDRLKQGDIIQVIWLEETDRKMFSYLYTFISSNSKKATINDINGNHASITPDMIISKIIKTIPITSEEGFELFAEIGNKNVLKKDLKDAMQDFSDEHTLKELRIRLKILEELK